MEIINVFEEDGVQTRSTIDNEGNITTSIESLKVDTMVRNSLAKLLDQINDEGVVSKEDIAKVEVLESGIITNTLPLGSFTSIPSSVGVEQLKQHLNKLIG